MEKLYAPLSSALSLFTSLDALPSPQELNQILSVPGITFVPQGPKSDDLSDGYEQRIYLRGEVQTRDQSWHDFFNALVWRQFTQTKKLINQLQFQLQQQRFPAKQRLPAENMLTLFDENGALVIARDPQLLELICEHRWHELFWERREQVKSDLRVIIFGHGLYEKALQPYVGLTAQSLFFVEQDTLSVDAQVSTFLSEKNFELRTSDLHPLPILGLPGWWPDNNNEVFYRNADYFRPKP